MKTQIKTHAKEITHGTCLPPEAYIQLARACKEPRYASTFTPRKEITK
jgi:hypothetical protein